MKPFCRVAHAGTSSTNGIYCWPWPPDRIEDEEALWSWLPEQSPYPAHVPPHQTNVKLLFPAQEANP